MLDLQIRVKELQTENDYQLHLKDMNYNEKIKELKDIFTQEIGSLKTKHQVGFILQCQIPRNLSLSLFELNSNLH